MRSAPAVTVRCRGGSMWFFVQVALPALAAAALSFWAAQHLGLDLAWCGVCALLGSGAVALRAATLRTAACVMCWDGTAWTCDGQPVQPQVMVDTGGSWMLLRLQPAGAPEQIAAKAPPMLHRLKLPPAVQWLAVCERDAGPLWHPWRAALYGFEPLNTATSSERIII